jgi:hypothetical protein
MDVYVSLAKKQEDENLGGQMRANLTRIAENGRRGKVI